MSRGLDQPLIFVPIYKTLVWGGRRMQSWRPDLPPGPIGESWDLSDHPDALLLVKSGKAFRDLARDLPATVELRVRRRSVAVTVARAVSRRAENITAPSQPDAAPE